MHSIEHLNKIKSPVEKVYRTLTTQAGLSAIWTEKLKVNSVIGQINEFDFDEGYITKMKIDYLKKNNQIIWHCVNSDDEWTGTWIVFEMKEEENQTSIILKHSHWKEVTDYYRWCNYHWAMFLYRLKIYCEN